MKKLKIFLLLSILLCFGFTLSSEVHAQGDGPKLFEVDDVLPATTQLRIRWIEDITYIGAGESIQMYYDGDWYNFIYRSGSALNIRTINPDKIEVIYDYSLGEFKYPYTNYDGDHAYIDIDTSTWPISARTIVNMNSEMYNVFTWEDLAPQTPSNAKPFEISDVLPRTTRLRISWDNLINSYLVSGGGYYQITAKSEFIIATCGEDVNGNIFLSFNIYEEPYHQYGMNVFTNGWVDPYTAYGDGHNYIDVDTSMWSLDRRTIMNVSIDGLYWEDLNAPSGNGNGNGNGSTGASDFYNNFDKYFIPAMIIVFGGAIVLTILKVFKGRE